MFIETILFTESGSPFMGAMKSVPLLKEFPTIDLFFWFYKHFTATRFFSTSSSDEDPFIS